MEIIESAGIGVVAPDGVGVGVKDGIGVGVNVGIGVGVDVGASVGDTFTFSSDARFPDGVQPAKTMTADIKMAAADIRFLSEALFFLSMTSSFVNNLTGQEISSIVQREFSVLNELSIMKIILSMITHV